MRDLLLLLPFPFTIVGQTVEVYAGCDHTAEPCATKFFTTEDPQGNLRNYGGFLFVPTKNPFESGLD